jgi:hypothetical protein
MQALDNFMSLIPGFDGDILIPAVPVLARPPGDEPMSDTSIGASASALKTQVGKQKAMANPTPQKKSRKTIGRSASGIKINEPTLKTPTSTPPSGPRWKFLIQRSKRYALHKYVSSTIF